MRLSGRFFTIAFAIALSVAALAPGALTAAWAQTAQAAPSDNTTGAVTPGNVASVDPNAAQQKGLAGKAIDKVKEVAKSAGDILSRVPCRSPKGGLKTFGSLPHVAAKLADGKPVVIVAFGSSSTQGYGSTSSEYTYPNRLAAQLRRHYPAADITVLNRG